MPSQAVVNPGLLEACLADLGRERQEDLPLNNQSSRGPTFLPGKRTGVDHISKKVREKLAKGWGAKIDDEESRQMEGLEHEDARPWAKSKDVHKLDNGKASSNTGGTKPKSQKNKIPSPTKTKPQKTNASPTKARVQKTIVSPTKAQPQKKNLSPTRTKAPTKNSPTKSKSNPLNDTNDTKIKSQKNKNLPSTKNRSHAIAQPRPLGQLAQVSPSQQALQRNIQAPSEPAFRTDENEHILCQGHCEVLQGNYQKELVAAQVALRANLKTSRGSFLLRARNGGEKAHDVLKLETPCVEGAVCKIVCQMGKTTETCDLKFQTSNEAEEFSRYLQALQQSAAHATKESSTVNDQSSGSTESRLALIDIDGGIPNLGQDLMQNFLVESFAKIAHNIIREIQVSMIECGIPISQKTVEIVEDTVLSNLDQYGIVNHQGSSDETRDGFKQILRAAVDFKLKVDADKKQEEIAQVPAIKALQADEERPKKQDGRIQYTAGDIVAVEKRRRDKDGMSPPGTKAGQSADKAKTKPQGLASSRWATQADDGAIHQMPCKIPSSESTCQALEPSNRDLSSTVAAIKPGLKSSIWAS